MSIVSVDVMHVDPVVHGSQANLVGRADHLAAFNAPPPCRPRSHRDCDLVRLVHSTAFDAIGQRCTAEVAAPNQQGAFSSPRDFKSAKKACNGFIHPPRHHGVVLVALIMAVPTHRSRPYCLPSIAGQNALRALPCGAPSGTAFRTRRYRAHQSHRTFAWHPFLWQIGQFGNGHLHLERQFIRVHAGRQIGVVLARFDVPFVITVQQVEHAALFIGANILGRFTLRIGDPSARSTVP